MAQETTQPSSSADSEIWMRCYIAAITGVLAAHQGAAPLNPDQIVQQCGEVADAALLRDILEQQRE